MRDNLLNFIMSKSKRFGDCSIITECLAVREVILMAIQNGGPRIIVQDDSQLVTNSINRKICVSKGIVNLAQDVKCLLSHFKDRRIEYSHRIINRDGDALVKRVHL